MSDRYPLTEWAPLDPSRVRNIGHDSDYAPTAFRLFAPPGKIWPRIVVAVNRRVDHELGVTLVVSASIKRDSKAWWDTCAIPGACWPLVVSMLAGTEP